MMPILSDPQVIIVGAGPTGLLAAGLLARCGVSVRIFDKIEHQVHETRAFGIQAKSLELLLSLGLADEFLRRGRINLGGQIHIDGQLAAELNFDDIGRDDTPYSFLLMLPQSETEAILAEDLRRHGIEVERGVEVNGFTQSEAGVAVQARTKGGETLDLHCQYLIGADGAHSMVRKKLGLTFEGAPYPHAFLLADCHVEWPLNYERMRIFLGIRELAVFLPLQGPETSRIMVLDPRSTVASGAQAEASGGEPLELEEVQAAARAAMKVEVALTNPKWVSRYRLHHRGVNRYRVGRVLVAGDAAHIHSPAGGQGMNTGLQDAANLAWKLALALRAPSKADALLESYHLERWPVGERVLKYTDKVFSMLTAQSGWVAALRNFLIPTIMGTLTKSGRVRARAFHFISQLGIRYEGTEFLREEVSAEAPTDWKNGLTAGHRAPNGTIRRGADVFGLLGGYCFHLLAFSRRPLEAAEIGSLRAGLNALQAPAGIELRTHLIANSLGPREDGFERAESNQIFETYGVSHETPQALFLVRPDGYIAYRSAGLELSGVTDFLRLFS